jgi:hypothetical protein
MGSMVRFPRNLMSLVLTEVAKAWDSDRTDEEWVRAI